MVKMLETIGAILVAGMFITVTWILNMALLHLPPAEIANIAAFIGIVGATVYLKRGEQ